MARARSTRTAAQVRRWLRAVHTLSRSVGIRNAFTLNPSCQQRGHRRYFVWQKIQIFLLSGLVEMAFAHSHTGQRVPDLTRFWMLTSHGLGQDSIWKSQRQQQKPRSLGQTLGRRPQKMNELRLHLALSSLPDRWGKGERFCSSIAVPKYSRSVCARTRSQILNIK